MACPELQKQTQFLENMNGTDEFLFRALAADLEAMIVRGDYRAGEKLPSVRTLHRQRNIAMGTVCQALAELDARGLVTPKARSGYFVNARRTFVPPTTRVQTATPQRVPALHLADDFVAASADPTLVPFGGAVLSPALVPLKQIGRITRELTTRRPDVFTSYGPPSGHPDLTREIAKHLLTLGIRAEPADVVITSGAMNAMRLAIGVLTQPGDTVAIESPTFFALLPMLRDAGLLVAEIPIDPTSGLNLDALESLLNRRRVAAAIVTPTHQNPTGACMAPPAKKRLLKIARAHALKIIEDDVYGDLSFSGERPKPLAAYATKADAVLYCASFSKTLAAGLRVGFIAPGAAMPELARAKLASTIASPVLNQLVLAEFLATGAYQRHLRKLRAALLRNKQDLLAAVDRYFPTDVEVSAPVGGFCLWLRLKDGLSSRELYLKAKALGVSILPGEVCAIDARFRSYVRLSFGHAWSPKLEHGMKQLGHLIATAERSSR
jgi:DNA-binding transcriptional MocR family regulator